VLESNRGSEDVRGGDVQDDVRERVGDQDAKGSEAGGSLPRTYTGGDGDLTVVVTVTKGWVSSVAVECALDGVALAGDV